MNDTIQLTNTIPSIRNSPNRSPLGCGLLLIASAVTLAMFALSPTARAADGGLPNENTAEGDDALLSLTTGRNNTANGDGALFNNTKGNLNTATGQVALSSNTTGSGNTANGVGALAGNTTADGN